MTSAIAVLLRWLGARARHPLPPDDDRLKDTSATDQPEEASIAT
jgi:hypothetical protein